MSSSNAFLLHGATPSDLVHLHSACALRLSVQVLEQIERTQTGAGNGHAGQTIGLTPREQQILQGIVRGERDREIADRLGLSVHTVKNHVYDLRQKIGARSRTEAAVRAVRAGLVVETGLLPDLYDRPTET